MAHLLREAEAGTAAGRSENQLLPLCPSEGSQPQSSQGAGRPSTATQICSQPGTQQAHANPKHTAETLDHVATWLGTGKSKDH